MPAAARAQCPSPAARRDGYARRRPEQTLLYQVVREHWPAFRERAAERGGLPEFVERDFEEYLRCGIPEHGLVHLRCGSCGHAKVVAFSCKRRAPPGPYGQSATSSGSSAMTARLIARKVARGGGRGSKE